MRCAASIVAGLALALTSAAASHAIDGAVDLPVPPAPAITGPPGDRPASGPAGVPSMDLELSDGSRARRIPWDALDRESYLRVRDVVAGAFAAREVRDITFRSRPEVLEFLLDHPDFASQVGVALRRGRYRLHRAGDAYEADDGEGARGRMWQVLHEKGRRLFYIEGRYEGMMLPVFSGRLVVVLDTEHLEGLDGLTYCEARFAGFVRFDSGLAEILVRVTQSLAEARVDRNVRRFFKHVAAVSRRAYDDPEGLADQLEGRPGVAPEMLARFREVLTGHLPPRWARLEAFQLGAPAGLDEEAPAIGPDVDDPASPSEP